MSETPSQVKWSSRPVGFDNRYVFQKILGLPLEEIKRLEFEKVIFGANPAVPSQNAPPDWDGKSGLKLP